MRAVRGIRVTANEGGAPTSEEAREAAAVLREDGVVVLLSSQLAAVAPTSTAATALLSSTLTRAKLAGVKLENRFRFSEIAHRFYRRFDLPLSRDDPFCAGAFVRLLDDLVEPVLANISEESNRDEHRSEPPEEKEPRIIRNGLVISVGGAKAQAFHADGPAAGLFNAFVPLVRVATHGTEFWLGSHDDPYFEKSDDGGEDVIPTNPNHISTPVLNRAEGVIVFDYRVVHRGRAHDAAMEPAPRPVFYRVYALPSASCDDSHNYSELSIDEFNVNLSVPNLPFLL